MNTYQDLIDFINYGEISIFPKTYEECCGILDILGNINIEGYRKELLLSFQKLIICRDAYWKIAGEQMGLGKPWEPNWSDDLSKYYISFFNYKIDKGVLNYSNKILAFPTEEMRDEFYENFKDLIEQCKEFL